MKIKRTVNVLGCGFAGIECALFLASHGINVHIFCDKQQFYKCDCLTCENLAKTTKNKNHARDLLREELKILNSALIEEECKFTKNGMIECGCVASRLLEYGRNLIKNHAKIKVFELNVKELDTEEQNVVATGTHTSKELFDWLKNCFGSMKMIDDCYENPIVSNIDKSLLYKKEGDQSEDLFYPLSYQEYVDLCNEIVKAHNDYLDLSKSKKLDSGEFTIEKLIGKGKDALKNHALRECKLVGLQERPYAVLRFKKHELGYELCGLASQLPFIFQDKIIFALKPCKNAKLVKESRVISSCFINSPYIINQYCQSVKFPTLFFAGSIIGLDGHLEAMASGLVTAMNLLTQLKGKKFVDLPKESMIYNLIQKLLTNNAIKFSPILANYDIIEEKLCREELISRSKQALAKFMEDFNGKFNV